MHALHKGRHCCLILCRNSGVRWTPSCTTWRPLLSLVSKLGLIGEIPFSQVDSVFRNTCNQRIIITTDGILFGMWISSKTKLTTVRTVLEKKTIKTMLILEVYFPDVCVSIKWKTKRSIVTLRTVSTGLRKKSPTYHQCLLVVHS